MKLAAKTFYGFEGVLSEELRELGAKNIVAGNRVVTFEGDDELIYRSNLWLRTAINILVPIKSFHFKSKEDLIRQFNKIDFGDYMTDAQTFAIKGAVFSKLFTNTQYPYLLLKDAIVDYFTNKIGKRPNVEKFNPNIIWDLHIQENECTLSLNSSGAPLFQRGYRQETGPAPLNEIVAAGMILLSGWDKKSNFIDVMCGSGTIVIEAALMANGIPANIARKNYAFMHWKQFNRELWNKIYDEAPKRPPRKLDFKIIGSDTDGSVVLKARQNAKNVPLGMTLEFEVKDFKDQVKPGEKGILMVNPPYGERIGDEDEIPQTYKELGDFFKKEMVGYDCWVISGSREGMKSLELKPSAKINLFNGNLPCELRKYEIFEGSYVEQKKYSNERREPKRLKKNK